MKVKIILILILFFLLNSAKGEQNPQNITIELHQVLEFSSETDATVIDTIRTNENWIIPIGSDTENSTIVNYFIYIDDPNSLPIITLYRPTRENRIPPSDYNLSKNKTLIRKYTILHASSPIMSN